MLFNATYPATHVSHPTWCHFATMETKVGMWITSTEGLRAILITLVAIAVGLYVLKDRFAPKSEPYMPGSTIFDFMVDSNAGQPVSLSEYKGKKAYLIVNVASK